MGYLRVSEIEDIDLGLSLRPTVVKININTYNTRANVC